MTAYACVLWALALLAAAGPLGAQEHAHHGHEDGDGWRFGAQAVGLATRVSPGIGGETRTEGYLTQPALMAHGRLWNGRIGFTGMLNLEALTIPGGELTMGAWGEGYVDRRHPHTYLHEAVVSLRGERGRLAGSISAGKGFAPFGTDDPMFRPFVKYPVNHHLAQVLERAVAIGAVRWGATMLELGAFNGEEPEDPGDAPNLDRLGDSWAARLSVAPVRGLELQASHARLESPESPVGGGYDHRKWSISGRWERVRDARTREYALVEWAATQMYDDDRRAQRLTTWLGEAALRRRGVELAGRLESTLRMEEERLEDTYRSPYPHTDVHALGITRWNTATAAVSAGFAPWSVELRPFAEVSYARPSDHIRPAIFEARPFYGDDEIWTVSLGIRMGAGVRHDRMGRYGVAGEPLLPGY